ncbi:uncharacterized protein B0I36DRAFT_369460 [Microdochium trichocladiopsis]|uniref:Uncharacterized protein n=1 Tax=Microdochium trichocladiopsis TaxID=1682393 RepID=A0A9P8XUE4_9PEZI|nr:uncharacterized protein B0I36DRAFT_369460 [Microdochium trichocladiopsis]KAH7014509.1 hypothetical protein B0I36DRAFT_369460 [Microdochium trichocladiopsis]
MGLLIPPWYQSETPNRSELNDASLVLGATIPLAVFTFVKNGMQTQSIYERRKSFTPFVIMCWAEWAAAVALAAVSYLFLTGIVPPSFWTFFTMSTSHLTPTPRLQIQMQCILQIIINRVALIVANPTQVRRIRLVVFAIASAINISGYPIWIPARLQLTPHWAVINFWWDRSEKVLYALVDIALNGYFMYHVRTKLIQMGLTKYKKLLYANIAMACVSVGTDILVLGAMSLRSQVIYAQFHPLQFLVKLLIELFMADLIAKIVREDNRINTIANGYTDTGGTTADEMQAILARQGGADSFSQALERFGNTQTGTIGGAAAGEYDDVGTHHHMQRKAAVTEVSASRGGGGCGDGVPHSRRKQRIARSHRAGDVDGGDIADELTHQSHGQSGGAADACGRGVGSDSLDITSFNDFGADEKALISGSHIPQGVIVQTTTTVVTTEPAGPPRSWWLPEDEEEQVATTRSIQACEACAFDSDDEEDESRAIHHEDRRSDSAPP